MLLFRWGIFFLACAYIYVHLTATKSSRAADALLDMLPTARMSVILGTVAVLMVVNWWLEAAKWRHLVQPLQPIGMWRSFIATVAGTSVALISPNRTGEFIGRVMFLHPENRIRGAVATMWGGVAQFMVTLIVGLAAILIHGIFQEPLMFLPEMLLFALIIITITAFVLYLQPSMVERLLLRWEFLQRFREHLDVLDMYAVKDLLIVLLLSAIRYAVFTLQFILLLVMLDLSISTTEAILAVPIIFLITSVIPTVLLTELGIRGSVALVVLLPMGATDHLVLLATFCIWVINLLFPAIAGSLILLVAKIRLKTAQA